jgi:hypothetical protein
MIAGLPLGFAEPLVLIGLLPTITPVYLSPVDPVLLDVTL